MTARARLGQGEALPDTGTGASLPDSHTCLGSHCLPAPNWGILSPLGLKDFTSTEGVTLVTWVFRKAGWGGLQLACTQGSITHHPVTRPDCVSHAWSSLVHPLVSRQLFAHNSPGNALFSCVDSEQGTGHCHY